MNAYATILMSHWRGTSSLKAPDLSKAPKLLDPDKVNTDFPINEETRNRDASIVRAMDARTPPLVRQQLMASIDTLPPDPDTSGVSDEDKLTMMKSRYCQSRPEMADYREYLSGIVEDGKQQPSTASVNSPAVEPDPKVDDSKGTESQVTELKSE